MAISVRFTDLLGVSQSWSRPSLRFTEAALKIGKLFNERRFCAKKVLLISGVGGQIGVRGQQQVIQPFFFFFYKRLNYENKGTAVAARASL